MRKLVRIGSNVKIPGDSHYKNNDRTVLQDQRLRMWCGAAYSLTYIRVHAEAYHDGGRSQPARRGGLRRHAVLPGRYHPARGHYQPGVEHGTRRCADQR